MDTQTQQPENWLDNDEVIYVSDILYGTFHNMCSRMEKEEVQGSEEMNPLNHSNHS
jgi:hypothetical protein